ncbi:MAG TPA: PDZ domain-containing protein [Candidatus Dormibacteraeota bacterium]|nr:PDZ domain-containing protein [Candidatus Dormibacteraeota bacterium]
MNRIVSVIVSFAAGFAVATIVNWMQVPEAPPPEPPRAAPLSGRGFASATARDTGGDSDQRVRDLESRLARETSARERAQNELNEVNAHLTALREGRESLPPPPQAARAEAAAAQADAAANDQPTVDYSKSEMERALIAGGLDPNKAADIKRRSDSLAMAEMYLRDQATREEWLDSPRYQEEMAALHAQQVSIRDELGDDGYDKYLFALGQTNRVRVDDVMTDSPAAQAGLETGDMILRYADTRVFAPDELVAQTQQGEPGETVSLVIIRQGKLMTVEVPRGPLGLRVAATQSTPQS